MAEIRNLEACPECGARWAYRSAGGEALSRLVGIYDLVEHRTVSWVCPECARRWPRGATVENRPG